jgi:two-component system sensor histidine kinase KdpD
VEVQAVLQPGPRLRLRIRDHGPGLPAGAEEKVFQKFYRVPGSPAGGTGLGLSIARSLLSSLGGGISAANVPGGGAEFVVTLPVSILSPTASLPS